jgi:hypothetical protein
LIRSAPEWRFRGILIERQRGQTVRSSGNNVLSCFSFENRRVIISANPFLKTFLVGHTSQRPIFESS